MLRKLEHKTIRVLINHYILIHFGGLVESDGPIRKPVACLANLGLQSLNLLMMTVWRKPAVGKTYTY